MTPRQRAAFTERVRAMYPNPNPVSADTYACPRCGGTWGYRYGPCPSCWRELEAVEDDLWGAATEAVADRERDEKD